jgi:hypothetical protein
MRASGACAFGWCASSLAQNGLVSLRLRHRGVLCRAGLHRIHLGREGGLLQATSVYTHLSIVTPFRGKLVYVSTRIAAGMVPRGYGLARSNSSITRGSNGSGSSAAAAQQQQQQQQQERHQWQLSSEVLSLRHWVRAQSIRRVYRTLSRQSGSDTPATIINCINSESFGGTLVAELKGPWPAHWGQGHVKRRQLELVAPSIAGQQSALRRCCALTRSGELWRAPPLFGTNL